MNTTETPLQYVQVIQQPLTAPYLQQIYSTPHQQVVFSGDLTQQHPGMITPTLQNIGATQGLCFQSETKSLDSRNSDGQTQTQNSASQVQVIQQPLTAPYFQQIYAAPHQQMFYSGEVTQQHPGMTTSTLQSVGAAQGLNFQLQTKSVKSKNAGGQTPQTKNSANKTYQPQALQPMYWYSSPGPVHSSAQVFNGGHLKQITSQPQIITSQAPGTIFSQAQIFGSYASLPQGLSWTTTGNLQSPTFLSQNHIILHNQQGDVFIQPKQTAMHLTNATPKPATTIPTTPIIPNRKKTVRTKRNYRRSAAPFITATPPLVAAPQMATTETNKSLFETQPDSNIQLKSDAANQTLSNHAKTLSISEYESSPQNKSLSASIPLTKSQAVVAPIAKIVQTALSPSITSSAVTLTSSEVTTIMSTTPVVSTFVNITSKTASVAPERTSTETCTSPSTSPYSSNFLEDVDRYSDIGNSLCLSDTSIEEELLEKISEIEKETDQVEKETEHIEKEAEHIEKETEHIEKETEPTEKEIVVPLCAVKPLPPVKDKQPQKAVIKPRVLTHIIEGFEILEFTDPILVNKSSLYDPECEATSPEKLKRQNDFQAASPKKKIKIHFTRSNKELANCKFCGILGEKSKFKRFKGFCSKSCFKCQSPKQVKVQSTGGSGRKRGRPRKKIITTSDLESTEMVVSEISKLVISNSLSIQELPSAEKIKDCEDLKTEDRQSQKLSTKWNIVNESLDGSPEIVENNSPPAEDALSMITMVPDVSKLVILESLPAAELPLAEKIGVGEALKSESSLSQKSPINWSVQDVFDFIRELPDTDCSDCAETFRLQEIDGQALLLLNENQLMSVMSMKLGPALKLLSHINSIKEL